MDKINQLLDYREPEWVAEKLGLDKNTVYKYLQEGALPGIQLGRKWLVSERLLAEHLERETRKQTQLRVSARSEPMIGSRGLLRRGGPKLAKTPRLRRSLDAARAIAWRSGAESIGTEHALLGIVEVPDGCGAVILQNLGVTPEKLREQFAVHTTPKPPQGDHRVPVSQEARYAFQLAHDEAIGLGHDYLGGEHLLLGILREPVTLGARMLEAVGVTYDAARAELLKHIRGRE